MPYRLEDISFGSVAPYLRSRGMDEETLQDLHALLRATDISKPTPDQPSPAQAVRDGVALPGLERFQGNEALRLMAIVLQAADIMPSAAISEACSRRMSDYLEEESGLAATPQNFAWFADNIARETGGTWNEAKPGDPISGVYQRRVDLASGRFAVIDDGLGFQLVPWNRGLEERLGQEVRGVVSQGGGIDWALGRKRGIGL